MWWKQGITSLKGIGKKKATDLGALQIETLGDLLEYYPRQGAYLDYSLLKSVRELSTDGAKQQFLGTVIRLRDGRSARGRSYTQVTVGDETGYAELYFFQGQRYAAKKLKPDMRVLVTGSVKPGRSAKTVADVAVQIVEGDNVEVLGILPVYSLSGSITQKNMRDWIAQVLMLAEKDLQESLPDLIISKHDLMPRLEAIRNIHFPESRAALAKARQRLIYEELFLLQCGLLFYGRKNASERRGVKHVPDAELLQRLQQVLPFALTAEQNRVWGEISLDMQEAKPMHRILQGDVGSGKTVIGAMMLTKTVENGFQGCLMAPTEILAVQHHKILQEYFSTLGIRIALLTGGIKGKKREELLRKLEFGEIDIVVGTHALLQEDVRFANLAAVIADEQHRFGVEQRAKLANKAAMAPDVLVMTATPIPRTLALTVYGDLDISQMKGKPPGRKPVKTLCYTDEKRRAVYEGLVRQVKEGRQAYVVCPLIEQSEQMNARSAEQVYEELKKTFLHDIPCALLHGRLKNEAKEKIMTDFSAGVLKVLVSTTVIEVGVNVPNASLMIIENAERFGLAQLHQLRGRVGRGDKQSFCVLLAGVNNPEVVARLQVLHESEDGFYLAEKDLQLRGAGQLFGFKQHGLPDLRVADIIRDTGVIIQARKDAQTFLSDGFGSEQLPELVRRQFGERFRMIFNT